MAKEEENPPPQDPRPIRKVIVTTNNNLVKNWLYWFIYIFFSSIFTLYQNIMSSNMINMLLYIHLIGEITVVNTYLTSYLIPLFGVMYVMLQRLISSGLFGVSRRNSRSRHRRGVMSLIFQFITMISLIHPLSTPVMLPDAVIRQQLGLGHHGVHETLDFLLTDMDYNEVLDFADQINAPCDIIPILFNGTPTPSWQIIELVKRCEENQRNKERIANNGLTGKEAINYYTGPMPYQSSVRRPEDCRLITVPHWINDLAEQYRGGGVNDLMDDTDDDAFDSEEDEDEGSPEPQESDEEISEDDESCLDSEDEEDIDPEKDFDLHEPDDRVAAMEEESILETLDNGSSEDVKALFTQEQDHPEEVNHPNIYDIPKTSPEECKQLIKERIHDINDAPQDLEEKKYDPICHRLLRGQHGCFSWLPKVPTRKSYKYKTTGKQKKAFPTPISCNLNIRDKSDTGPERQLLFIFLRFMPDNLRNAYEAISGGKVYEKNGGKNLHPAEAMFTSEDRMIASSVEILRSGFGTPFWMKNVVMIETNPVSFPYGGKLSNVYGPRWIGEVRRRYTEVVKMAVDEAKKSDGRVKILLASSGVRDEFIDMIGGKAEFDNLRKNHPDLFVNVADDPVKDFKTMTHPETFTNKKIISKHGNSFPSRTKTLSKVVTQGLQHITQKQSIESDIGDQIFNELKGSPGYMAVVAAMKALHERNRERYRKGEGSFQLYAIEELKKMGWPDVDGKEAISFYLTEMYRGGEGSLQLYAVGECKRLGLGDVDPMEAISILFKNGKHPLQNWALKKCKDSGVDGIRPEDALSFYMSDLWKKGENPLQNWALKKCKDSGVDGIRPEDALSFYMSELWKKGENPLQNWVLKKCKDLGYNGIRPEDAMSFYMSELWKRGENPLQLWALKKCKDSGIEGISAQDAMSFYMSDLWGKGENPLQSYYQKKCQDHGYLIGGRVPSPKDAKDVYQQHESFNRHLKGIQKLAKDKENFEVLDNNKKVFYPSKSDDDETYNYIHNTLLRLDEDDWRKKRLSEKLDLFFDEDSWDKALPIRTTRRAKEKKSQREKAKKRELKDEKFTTGEKMSIGNTEDDISNFLKRRQR